MSPTTIPRLPRYRARFAIGKLLCIAGSALALLAFFLPWLSVETEQGVASASAFDALLSPGLDLITQLDIALYAAFAAGALAMVVILTRATRWPSISGVMRFCALNGLYAAAYFVLVGASLANAAIGAGAWLSLLGFVVAALGAYVARAAYLNLRAARRAADAAARRPWGRPQPALVAAPSAPIVAAAARAPEAPPGP